MNKIFEVRSTARDDGKLHGWGACRTHAEAEQLLADKLKNKEWAEQRHTKWCIEEIDTTGLFKIPSLPSPRDRYKVKTIEVESSAGYLDTVKVDVLDCDNRLIFKYDRNYPSLFRTFEPFRQGNRMFALISMDYTATAVFDLDSGKVIAAEEPHSHGFCPVGFYVPDWWDLHDGSILPGSMSWSDEYEHPKGDFGFVWGCIWGDDSSWKVQYLDLSRIQQGEIKREERFGYLPINDAVDKHPKEFIELSFYGGQPRVTFSCPKTFDLKTGSPIAPEDL